MFTTTIAGSLPKPGWLAEPEKLWAPWRLEGAELDQAKRDAALLWIKEQGDASIEAALPFVDAERLCPCTNCGMAPLPRAIATAKLQALGAGAELARKRHG